MLQMLDATTPPRTTRSSTTIIIILLLTAPGVVVLTAGEAEAAVGAFPATAVSAGEGHSCALLSNGNVQCWGDNDGRQSVGYSGGNAVGVSAGGYHSCALLSNGNVQCWGNTAFGESAGYSGGNAVGVSAGGQHSCALLSNGNIQCWGRNDYGQSAGYSGGNAIGMSAGVFYSCALLSNGNVQCWGDNIAGQSAGYSGGNAVGVSAGGAHSCALLSNGSVQCWGRNDYGQSAGYSGGNAVGVSAGGWHSCVLLSNGNVQCWGNNSDGQSAGYFHIPIHDEPPTGVKSCAVYNAAYSDPYPGQNVGVVVEYDPPGTGGDVALCAGSVIGAPCEAGQPGVLVNNQQACIPKPNPCPTGVNADQLAACGIVGPLCASGVANASATTVAACGVGPYCASGIENVDAGTLTACGAGPMCPGGLVGSPGAGQLALVCGNAISACSVSGAGPAPGWTVGAQGVCVGLPWAQTAAAPCPGATINVRFYWGTTPGFPPGSTFDVCV